MWVTLPPGLLRTLAWEMCDDNNSALARQFPRGGSEWVRGILRAVGVRQAGVGCSAGNGDWKSGRGPNDELAGFWICRTR